MMQMQANGSNPAMPPPGGGPMPPGVSRPMMDPASQMQMRQRMQQMMAMRGQGAGAPYPSTNLFSRQGGGISGLMPNAGPPAGYAAGGPVLWKPITEPAGGGGGINTLPAVTAVNPTVVAPPIVQPAVAAAPAVPAGQIALASTVPKMSILSDTARRYLGGPGADMADYVATNFNKMKNPTIADYLRARDDMQKYQGMAQGWFRYGGGSSHGGGGGGGGYGSSAGSSGGGHLA